ncbi:MAG: phage protein NinX family protein [Leclercia adecarboxylata]|nr:phage protein NinX family protein [Leclercia adecarboxylata]
MDYSKLSDQEINGLVIDAISDGNQAYRGGDGSAIELLHQINTVEFGEHVEREEVYAKFDPCNNPADAWPIIVENNISLVLDNPSSPMATSNCVGWYSDEEPPIYASNQNPLRAAMTVFLMMQESANVQANPARPDIR